MTQKQPFKAYAMARQTVPKTRQIVMLYDGAVRYLQQAAEAIREKRIEDRYNLLVKASEIISGLQSCLDFEKGGEVAHLLHQFYTSLELRIFSIHRTGSAETCEQVIRDLKQMRDAWQHIDAHGGDQAGAPAGDATTATATGSSSGGAAVLQGGVTASSGPASNIAISA